MIRGTLPEKNGERVRVVVVVERTGKKSAEHGVFVTRRKGGYFVEPASYNGEPWEAKDEAGIEAGVPRG
jgi:hypothetical protein